jgi:hypothetical protein
MPGQHKSKESVKAYLLGNLDQHEATVLEEQYFSDPAFLAWIGAVEGELIADYLQGRLSRPEKVRFEGRYLEIPDLKKKVDAARRQLPVAARPAARSGWQLAAVAVLVAGCAISAWFLLRNHASRQIAGRTNPPLLLAVHLAPGLTKGDGFRQVEFVAPPGGRVRLSFELPGLRSPAECQVLLAMVDSSGRRNTVWNSGGLKTVAAGASQEARVELDSAALRFGDYVGEVLAPDGTTRETYSFRVNPPPQDLK